jgi:hypothetical protein
VITSGSPPPSSAPIWASAAPPSLPSAARACSRTGGTWWPRTQPAPAHTCSGTASAVSSPSRGSADGCHGQLQQRLAHHQRALRCPRHQPLQALPLAAAQGAPPRPALDAQEPNRGTLRSALEPGGVSLTARDTTSPLRCSFANNQPSKKGGFWPPFCCLLFVYRSGRCAWLQEHPPRQ